MTSTQIKLLIAVSIVENVEQGLIRNLLHRCHQIYVAYVMNPFNDIVDNASKPITSSSFDSQISKTVEEFESLPK